MKIEILIEYLKNIAHHRPGLEVMRPVHYAAGGPVSSFVMIHATSPGEGDEHGILVGLSPEQVARLKAETRGKRAPQGSEIETIGTDIIMFPKKEL